MQLEGWVSSQAARDQIEEEKKFYIVEENKRPGSPNYVPKGKKGKRILGAPPLADRKLDELPKRDRSDELLPEKIVD